MRYTLIASFETPTAIDVKVYKFWFKKNAVKLKVALDSWHLLGNGTKTRCHCSIIGPSGGWFS